MQWSVALRVAITLTPQGDIFNQADLVLLQLQSLEHSMSLITLGRALARKASYSIWSWQCKGHPSPSL